MRNMLHKLGFVVVAVLALVPLTNSSLVAQTANLYLTSPGSGAYMAGVYTSPYTAQITPGSNTDNPGSPIVKVICDDFSDDTYTDEDWNANVTNLSSVNSESSANTTVKWGQTGSVTVNDTGNGDGGTLNTTLTQAQAYDVAAVLAIDILGSTPPGNLQQQDLSYALWALFDTNGSPASNGGGALGWLNTYAGSGGGYVDSLTYSGSAGNFLSTAESAAMGDLLGAVEQVCGSAVTSTGCNTSTAQTESTYLNSNYNVTIYTYIGSGCSGAPTGCPTPGPQEFMTVTAVPEPSSFTALVVYLLVGGGSLLFFGRRYIS